MAIRLPHFQMPPVWQRFWRWWTEQLSYFVPSTIKKLFAQQSRRYLTFSSPETVQTWHLSETREIVPDGEIQLDKIALESDNAANGSETQHDTPTILLLTPGQYLLRILKLPAAAEENLHQVIAFELDKQTPFEAGQVYFSERIINRQPQGKKINVQVVLVRKDFLDDKISLLRAANIQPNAVDVAQLEGDQPIPLGFDLLPSQWQVQKNRRQQILNGILAIQVIALLIAALALPILHQKKIIAALEQKISQVRSQARQANDLKQQVEQLKEESRFAATKKQSKPALIQVLEDLSRRIPKDTWLTGFQYQKGQLRIDGRSPAASKLIELLEDSPYLKNLHFISPITQDRNTGLERFRISMEVSNEADQNASH